jgi:NADH-quinone oxidoreductase subunit G
MDKAKLILSAASFDKSDGAIINQKGPCAALFPSVRSPAYYSDAKKNQFTLMLESLRWIHAPHVIYTSRHVDWTRLDGVIAACVAALPQLQGIVNAAPNASFRIRWQKLAHSPHCSSDCTAMRANISVHETSSAAG